MNGSMGVSKFFYCIPKFSASGHHIPYEKHKGMIVYTYIVYIYIVYYCIRLDVYVYIYIY